MRYAIKICFWGMLLFSMNARAQQIELSNKNASREAKALYCYLQAMYGHRMLAGQMTSNWGIDELKYLQDSVGKQPAIRGLDFIDSSKNKNEVKFARQWWRKGGIPTIMWHWGAPSIGNGYENSKKEADIDKIFEYGTPENKAFWKELDEKAALLEKLKRKHIPVLWRPFHELNGNWFWWGKKGPQAFKKLWITMYNYYVHEKHLDNLIWVLGYADKPDSAWYPGRQYVDIAGADTYQTEEKIPRLAMYNSVKAIVGDTMPIPMHECGTPPDLEKSFAEGVKWSWFMEWHTDFLKKVPVDHLRKVYNSDLVVTLDKVPDILKVYGEGRPSLWRRIESFFGRLF
jgi:hypothetical protein